MSRRRLLTALCTFTLIATATPAVAAPAATAEPRTLAPACSERPRELPIYEFTDHRELGIELDRIERVSEGRVEVAQIGRSNRGREIWSARVGTGPKAVLLTSEIHGNEKTGTDALLKMLDWVGTSDSPKARRWRDRLTIVAIPKMNPDGAELDRRGNDLSWQEVVASNPQLRHSEPAWNYYTEPRQGDDYSERPGFDVNRDYNPDLNYVPRATDFPGSSAQPGWYITPEARAVRDVYRGLAAEFGEVDTYVDLHHQGACYVMPEDRDEFVTLSVSGRFVDDPATTPGYEKYAGRYDLDYSKRLNVAVYNALRGAANNRPVFGNVTLYPQDLHLPGTGLGSFALNGSGTVLFEVRGQTQTLGQRHRGMLTRAVNIGLDGMLSAIASGQVDRLDPADYDRIPPRGPNIGTATPTADPRTLLEP
ncbi:M14 family zinc carboxypeptidase [Amycolatopsis cihanbeyliensis]|uniref:Zinc carboxypeptidase n=1 Tax=Amycolatopsis cihanbeyliensis TaxID=1128664 RepID=A0A542CUG8_AMYCI|nr:M14 family zinc carboxypeptidase [Amycolatopsis cihanbeyliensis]TQI94472.1 zinc carboxypeptidase [Amycolatopsis cihanbeyliensis]